MSKIEDFYKNASDAQWEAIAAERSKVLTEEDAAAFKEAHGFMPESIRPYEVMHFHELKKQQQRINEALEALKHENEKLKSEMAGQKNSESVFPQWRKVKGSSVRMTCYTTQAAIDLFHAAVDKTIDEYGFQKYLAAAFVLEEALKRLGFENKD